jgi:Ser/Thr protein kinase RdoA (MazF antagonist)
MFFSAYQKIYTLTDQEKKYLAEMLVSACYHSTYLLERHYLLKKIDENLALCTSEDEWLWIAGQHASISKLVFD